MKRAVEDAHQQLAINIFEGAGIKMCTVAADFYRKGYIITHKLWEVDTVIRDVRTTQIGCASRHCTVETLERSKCRDQT